LNAHAIALTTGKNTSLLAMLDHIGTTSKDWHW